MTDWNPDDPDATRVHYDLSGWTFDQQAELAAALADSEVPHGWDGSELIVPEEVEEVVDRIVAEVEDRLGIVDSPGHGSDAGSGDAARGPVELPDDVPATEYDLADWTPLELQSVGHALAGAGIPFRWEGAVLLVPTDDDPVVDALLDDIESGEYVDVTGSADDDAASTEVLTWLFLAAERLRRDPLDPDGLEHLMRAVDVADPGRPPFGVVPRLWTDACTLADRVADALAELSGPDEVTAMAAAADLHELLRPHV